MIDLRRELELAEQDNLTWDFYEDHEDARQHALNTVPGRVVTALFREIDDVDLAARTVGLLSAFAARRSLACWFVYCADEYPLGIANQVIDYWVYPRGNRVVISPEWTTCRWPTDKEGPIVDCRSQETVAASEAVSSAAKFALTGDSHAAILALSLPHVAFDVSPIGHSNDFAAWLIHVAAKVAFAGREMSAEEQFALADFEFPPAMINAPR